LIKDCTILYFGKRFASKNQVLKISFKMLESNNPRNIICKFGSINKFMFNKRYIILFLCACILLLAGCKKTIESINQNTLQKFFEENILNRTFIVDLAKDTAVDKTSIYTGYEFILTKGSSYTGGPMTGIKNGITYSGTWSTDSAYSKLDILLNYPSVPTEFIFINRVWKFTKKSLPIMELAPWGTADPKVLNMRRL
jgi:hypothetical protein